MPRLIPPTLQISLRMPPIQVGDWVDVPFVGILPVRGLDDAHAAEMLIGRIGPLDQIAEIRRADGSGWRKRVTGQGWVSLGPTPPPVP